MFLSTSRDGGSDDWGSDASSVAWPMVQPMVQWCPMVFAAGMKRSCLQTCLVRSRGGFPPRCKVTWRGLRQSLQVCGDATCSKDVGRPHDFHYAKVTSQTAWYPHILQAGQQNARQNGRTYYIQLCVWFLQMVCFACNCSGGGQAYYKLKMDDEVGMFCW